MSGEWNDILAHYNGRKMIALSESGTLPNADLMETYGIAWSYFSLWKDGFLDDFTAQQVQALLNDEDIITLEELPVLPWSNTAPIPGDYNDDGIVDAGDYVVWRASTGQTGSGLAADSNLDGQINSADYDFWMSRFGQTAGSGSSSGNLPAVPEPAGILLLCLAANYIFLVRHRGAAAPSDI
jgi:hypothetical protein